MSTHVQRSLAHLIAPRTSNDTLLCVNILHVPLQVSIRRGDVTALHASELRRFAACLTVIDHLTICECLEANGALDKGVTVLHMFCELGLAVYWAVAFFAEQNPTVVQLVRQ